VGGVWYTGHVMPIFRNYKQIATTELRKQALQIIESGIKAVDPFQAVLKKTSLVGDSLSIDDTVVNLRKFKRVFFVGIGKASNSAAAAIEHLLGSKLTRGISLDVEKRRLRKIVSLRGDHPFPTERNVEATNRIKELLSNLRANDLVITAISGGGSALLCSLPKATCAEEKLITQIFFERGANIEEINTVRKHLSDLKGGGLAKLAYPATVVSLIFSDTPGCALDTVASGPTLLDSTSIKDARALIKEYRLPEMEFMETLKDKKYFRRVKNILMVCNMDALSAMYACALNFGFKAVMCGNCLAGEAAELGKWLAQKVRPGQALIGGGETVVTIKGKGRGGRNQELVLGALPYLGKESVLVSLDSDGIDNTDAAGAIADNESLKKAKRFGLDYKHYLRYNDSYSFFKKMDDLVFTGPTGTNIADLMVILSA